MYGKRSKLSRKIIASALIYSAAVAWFLTHSLQSKADEALDYFVAEDAESVTWYALGRSLGDRDAVSIRARLRLPDTGEGAHPNLSGIQEIWLAGISAEPEGRPNALAIAWTLDRSSWVPVWRLRITSELGLLPDPDPTNRYIASTARPQPGAEYMVELSYDRIDGALALRLQDISTGDTLAREYVPIRTFQGRVWPGVGILADGGGAGPLRVLDFHVLPEFVPVGARLYMTSKHTTDQSFSRIPPNEAVDRRHDLAFEIVAPDFAGRGTFSVVSGDGQVIGEVKADEGVDGSLHLVTSSDTLTLGHGLYTLNYSVGGRSWEVDRMTQSVGHLDVRLIKLDPDPEDAQAIKGNLILVGDAPMRSLVTLRPRWTELIWDDEQGRFKEGASLEAPSEVMEIDLDPTGVDANFLVKLPSSDSFSPWRLDLTVFVEALQATVPLQRVVLPVTDPSCDVRIMSFNILFPTPENEAGPNAWRRRLPFAMEVVRDADPVVIGFQEPIDNQLYDIDRSLPEYDRISVSANGRWNNAIYYDARRVDLIEWGRFWYSDHPETPRSSWDDRGGRATVWGLFHLRASGKRFYVFNTHLRAGADADQERIRSAMLLKEMIGKITIDHPVFLLGDFNARAPEHPVHRMLVGGDEPRFFDSWEAAAWRSGPIGTNHQLTGYTGHNNRIDWILFRGSVLPIAMEHITARRGPLFPSDHLPILGSFCLP